MPTELWDLSEFFFIHFCGRGSHFSKGHLSLAAKSTKSAILDFSGSRFIFVTTSISQILPYHCCIVCHCMEDIGAK